MEKQNLIFYLVLESVKFKKKNLKNCPGIGSCYIVFL